MKTARFIPVIAALSVAFLMGCPGATATTIGELVDDTQTETLYERYVEHYDANFNPLESWTYDSEGALSYAVYTYDTNGYNTEISTYSSDTTVGNTTLVSMIVYTYSGSNRTKGEQFAADGTTLQAYFDATYGAYGYTSYLEYEGDRQGTDDRLIEHRTCTWNVNGKYDVETYYSDATTDPASMIERYEVAYDSVDPAKYIREDHFLKLSDTYTSNLIHTFTWSGSDMYLQSDFNDSDDNGTAEGLISAIMYTPNVDSPKTRSTLNDKGTLMLYRTYAYDQSVVYLGYLTEVSYSNYNKSAGEELEEREVYRYYTNGDGDLMYEKMSYAYSYPSKGLDPGLSKARLWKPSESHYGSE